MAQQNLLFGRKRIEDSAVFDLNFYEINMVIKGKEVSKLNHFANSMEFILKNIEKLCLLPHKINFLHFNFTQILNNEYGNYQGIRVCCSCCLNPGLII